MSDVAPIVIFVYNRVDHVQQTVSALLQNIGAENSQIFFYSDAPKNDFAVDTVNAVRTYLHTISGFKQITIIERSKNFGLAKNIIEGVTEIINQYGQVIVLEDDLITSKNFISYMNQALDFYRDNEQIFAISGYTGMLPSLKDLDDEGYLSYRPSSWGWGTWKEEWEKNDWDVSDFDTFIEDQEAIRKFNRGGIDMTRMLKHCMQGKNHSWAIRWSYTMYKLDKLCFYPKVSKIQNIGFGDNATNCKGIDIYQTVLDQSDNNQFHFNKDIQIDPQIAKEFAYVFSYTNKALNKMKNIITKFIS